MKNIQLLSLLTVLAFLYLQGCSSESSDFTEDERVIPAVEVVQAEYGSLPLEERLSGIVEARNQVDIYPRISAPIEEVFAENGEQVEKGDILLRLRDNQFREGVRQAEANLRITKAQERQARAALGEVESQMNRIQILAERDLSSELEIEQIEAELESAKADLELAQAQVEQAESTLDEEKDALEQTVIRAPIDGTVGQRTAEVGMQANTANSLYTIGDLNASKITISLTERMLSYIENGQTARIYSENLSDTVITGEISRISPFLGIGNFSTEAEIEIGNVGRRLTPGMFVTVDVLYGESEQATLIPISALYRNPETGQTGVYIATNFNLETDLVEELANGENLSLSNPTDVEFVPIEIIAEGREAAGVTGINSGDWIVTIGQNLLIEDREGSTARIRAVSWNHVIGMQNMRPQDLLQRILDESEMASANSSNS